MVSDTSAQCSWTVTISGKLVVVLKLDHYFKYRIPALTRWQSFLSSISTYNCNALNLESSLGEKCTIFHYSHLLLILLFTYFLQCIVRIRWSQTALQTSWLHWRMDLQQCSAFPCANNCRHFLCFLSSFEDVSLPISLVFAMSSH